MENTFLRSPSLGFRTRSDRDLPLAVGLGSGHPPENRALRRPVHQPGFRCTHDEPYPPTGLRHHSYLLEASAPAG